MSPFSTSQAPALGSGAVNAISLSLRFSQPTERKHPLFPISTGLFTSPVPILDFFHLVDKNLGASIDTSRLADRRGLDVQNLQNPSQR